jgi:hypothetical protein
LNSIREMPKYSEPYTEKYFVSILVGFKLAYNVRGSSLSISINPMMECCLRLVYFQHEYEEETKTSKSSAICIIPVTNCLESYVNYIISKYLPKESNCCPTSKIV